MSARSLAEARQRVSDLAQKGIRLVESHAGHDQLDRLDAELAGAQAELRAFEDIDARRRHYLGDSDGVSPAGTFGPAGAFTPSMAAGGLGQAPPIMPDEPQLRELYEACRSHKSLRIDVTTKQSPLHIESPPVRVDPPLGYGWEPTRILDSVPATGTGAPVVEYVRIDSVTGEAAVVPPGGQKPEIVFETSTPTLTIPKTAAFVRVTDETLQDYNTFLSFATAELQRAVTDAENDQLLNSTDTAALGINTDPGVLVRDQATDTALDAVEQALADLRAGPAKATADLVIAHPLDFSLLRRTKDTQGRYLLNPDPAATEASTLWGVRVIQTTQQPRGTLIAGAFTTCVLGFVRQGLVIDADSSGTDWERNITRLRCEERVGLAIRRPTGVIKITLTP